MRMCGHDAYLPARMPKQSLDKYNPHIFSNDEIARILSLADGYQPTILSPNLSSIVPVAFRILYGCGLSCSELINLKIRDVDLENCRLAIRGSKFRKDRIVPMAASLARVTRQKSTKGTAPIITSCETSLAFGTVAKLYTTGSESCYTERASRMAAKENVRVYTICVIRLPCIA